jgi:hypothetical protein
MLLACGVCCALPASNEEFSAQGVFCGGVFFGLAALVIPVSLLTIVVAAAWAFYWARHSRLFLASLVLLGSAVSIVPWTVRDFVVRERLVPLQADFQRYLPETISPGPQRKDGMKKIVHVVELYGDHFRKNFAEFWELYPKWVSMGDQETRDKLHARDSQIVKETIYSPNRLINAVSVLSEGPIFFFALLGAAVMWLRRDLRRELSMFCIVVLSFAVGYSFFVGRIRYRIPVEPYLIILAAYGLYETYVMMSARVKSLLLGSESVTSRG